MKYIVDTSFLVFIAAEKQPFVDWADKRGVFQNNNTITSIVSEAEVLSIGQGRNWGVRKTRRLFDILNMLLIIPIQKKDFVNAYVEIDLYSKGKHPKSPAGLARRMGKNDLWIAATAAVTNTTLITTDQDFNHLKGAFIDLTYLNPAFLKN